LAISELAAFTTRWQPKQSSTGGIDAQVEMSVFEWQ
jgi:hypothetical protein